MPLLKYQLRRLMLMALTSASVTAASRAYFGKRPVNCQSSEYCPIRLERKSLSYSKRRSLRNLSTAPRYVVHRNAMRRRSTAGYGSRRPSRKRICGLRFAIMSCATHFVRAGRRGSAAARGPATCRAQIVFHDAAIRASESRSPEASGRKGAVLVFL
jgi:hypothetical protein